MNDPQNNTQPTPSSAATPAMVCPRCQGKGRLPHYNHVQNGVCFKCGGNGRLQQLSQAAAPASRQETVAPTPLGIRVPQAQLAALRASARPLDDCAALKTVHLPLAKLCKGRLTPSQWLFLVFVYQKTTAVNELQAYLKHIGPWTRAELADLHDRGYFLRTDRDLNKPLTVANAVVTERFTDLYHGIEIDVLYA